MAGRYNETEYAYSSAYIHAIEGKAAGREACERLSELHSANEVLAALGEYGFDLSVENAEEMTFGQMSEAVLASALCKAYNLIDEISPMKKLTAGKNFDGVGTVDFLRYQYDCNNIKSAIKCHIKRISCDDLLSPIGTIPLSAIKHAVKENDFRVMPRNMAAAAAAATELFAKNRNPQTIDTVIDRGCFSDMEVAATLTGVPMIKELFRMKIDMLNFMISLRVFRMGAKSGAYPLDLLRDSLAAGGKINISVWAGLFKKSPTEEDIFEVLSAKYPTVYAQLSEGISLSATEKITDNAQMELVKEAKKVTFGAPVLLGYIYSWEYAVKNIRIILAGKNSGMTVADIKERLRDCYV